MEILTAKNRRYLPSIPAMRLTHNNYAQLGVVNTVVQTYLQIISEFLISNVAFHTPSPLVCHRGNHPTAPLSQSMCGYRDDQESTKSQIAFMRSGFFFIGFIISLTLFMANQARAENLTIATASNFAHTLKKLTGDFTKQTGHSVTIVQGSSGALTTQIMHGLPVDIFLSADQKRIDKLIDTGTTLPRTRFTYAVGQLTLWSSNKLLIPTFADVETINKLIANPSLNQIAIANPKLAPYGLAAHQTIISLGLNKAVAGKIIYGQNIAQTFNMALNGGTALGFIARSQVLRPQYIQLGSRWDVPSHLHQPIKQDGIVLKLTKKLLTAKAFIAHIKSDKSARLITTFGYDVSK